MTNGKNILLGHGGGGRLSRELIDEEIVSRFGKGPLEGLPDAATLLTSGNRLVFSTDSFVVSPLEFPGGNVGDLAVHGTVNDVAVAGGRPKWLSLALILEEGLDYETLRRVLDSIRAAAEDCGVQIATGDTKVVARGQADGIYVNTAGLGEAIEGFSLGVTQVREGDVVLVSGTIGDHGMAVMAAREGLGLGEALRSDTGPVHRLVGDLETWAHDVRFMRDPTRGGVSSVLNEIVEGSPVGIELEEEALPFSKEASAISEVLGIDLLHVACEGRMIAIVDASVEERVLDAWRARSEGAGACRIGTVTKDAGRVLMRTAIGGKRLVDVPQGELLPRIC